MIPILTVLHRNFSGYEDALRDNGLPVVEELKIFENKIATVKGKNLLSKEGLSFDAVVATDDGLAVGALKYANKKQLRVPEDVNIVGFNNSELAVCCEPELTSVDNKAAAMRCAKQPQIRSCKMEGKSIQHKRSIQMSSDKTGNNKFLKQKQRKGQERMKGLKEF